MNFFSRPSILKRRKFLGVGAASIVSLLAARTMIPRLFRAAQPSAEHGDTVPVRPNPLAVPRSAKGLNSNG